MKFAVAAFAAIFAASSVSAAEIDFEYENFQMTRTGAAELVLKFRNNTQKTAAFIAADCAFLGEDGMALTTNPVIVQNVSPLAHAYGKTYGPQDARVKKADCRLRTVDYVD